LIYRLKNGVEKFADHFKAIAGASCTVSQLQLITFKKSMGWIILIEQADYKSGWI